VAPRKVLLRGERAARGLRFRLPLDRPPPLAVEILLTLVVLAGAAGYGAIRGGQIDAFVAAYGGVPDVVARALGFGVDIVTVSGATHMSEPRILAIAGVSAKDSLPFFDVAAARARLEADPLVKQASVRKLFPNQIVIDLVERTPYAVWQKDGELKAIAADGAPIDAVIDSRYAGLPFVVGDGANARAREFTALIGAMEELKPRVEAGVLMGKRRWNLRLKSGIDVKLPETDPQGAIATLLKLQREQRILDKDVLALDFRAPDRVFVRLTQQSADAWSETHSPKKKDAP
jgi:cell division protein FtsQ